MKFAEDNLAEPASTRQVLTVRQLNTAISEAVRAAFPATIWVRGEVQRLPADAARRTHVYFELHETGRSGAAEYQIPVSLMGWDRDRHGLGRYLDGSDRDFQLANQLEVCLECQVDFYAKFGKLNLKIVGVDKSFSLGRLEELRRRTLAYLKANGLLELNRSNTLSEIPLSIGLITSPGSAAERDFLTGIENSGYRFQVRRQGARMQGEQLQSEVIRALRKLADEEVDVIVITRGGGSRADLSWFDQQDLAEAIARCPVPVVTAIGHEIDRSIADLVAHNSCKTPTAAAEFLVARVDRAAERVGEAAARLRLLATTKLQDRRRLVQEVAGRCQQLAMIRTVRQEKRLAGLETRLAARTVAAVSRSAAGLERLQLRLKTSAKAVLVAAGNRRQQLVGSLRREVLRPVRQGDAKLTALAAQARLLDPERLLARGYTLTLDQRGKAVLSAAALAPGDRIRTRFTDGEVASIVQPDNRKPTSGKGKTSGGKGKKENPGQETLFR